MKKKKKIIISAIILTMVVVVSGSWIIRKNNDQIVVNSEREIVNNKQTVVNREQEMIESENKKIGISVKVPKNAFADYRKDYEFNIVAVKFSEGPIKSINTWLLYYGDANKSYQDRVKLYRDEIKTNQGDNQNEKKVYKEININGKTAFIEFIEKDDIFYVEAVRIP
ncbi:MAG: hypothetical protein ABFQ53_03200, partial [Patescibacteria group bacterium]